MEYIRGILPFTSPAHQTAFCSRSQLALLEALIAFRYTRNLGLPFSTDKSLINDFSKTSPASEKVCIHCNIVFMQHAYHLDGLCNPRNNTLLDQIPMEIQKNCFSLQFDCLFFNIWILPTFIFRLSQNFKIALKQKDLPHGLKLEGLDKLIAE